MDATQEELSHEDRHRNSSSTGKAHFVFVHGACHGAWCWYRMLDLLRASGHDATAIDLAASGVHPADPNSVSSFDEYSQPLLDFLHSLFSVEGQDPPAVILVGHSLGGLSISLAADQFPGKLAGLVYVVAGVFPSGLSFEDHFAKIFSGFALKFFYSNGEDKEPTSFIFTEASCKDKLYGRSPSEDVVLASLLLRPNPVPSQLAPDWKHTEEGFGSVQKSFIQCRFDDSTSLSRQESLAKEHGISDVFTIDADHSPFFSAPKDLHKCLLEIEAKYFNRMGL